MAQQRPIRILIGITGLGGHDRGARFVAQSLKEQGMEVIYLGLRQRPEQIVKAALQEDVDVIGLSSPAGGHNLYFPEVARLARDRGMHNVLIIGGGTIPEEDIPYLKDNGINAIFTPGTPINAIASYIRTHVIKR